MGTRPYLSPVPARTDGHLPEHPECPHCGSQDTELVSAFGTVLANAQYRCRACSTPFEFVKWLADE